MIKYCFSPWKLLLFLRNLNIFFEFFGYAEKWLDNKRNSFYSNWVGLKIKFSKNEKKYPVDIINLHKCTTSHDHMFSNYWDIGCNEWISFFVILGQFCCFTLITAWKVKFKKTKKTPRDIVLHLGNKNHDSPWLLP